MQTLERCGLPWPVCPDCLGQDLIEAGDTARCPSCRRRWPRDEVVPCPWAATARLWDAEGAEVLACRSHAASPSAGGLAEVDL